MARTTASKTIDYSKLIPDANYDIQNFNKMAKKIMRSHSMYAKTIKPSSPNQNCYLCSTTDNVQEIQFGEAGYNPKCICVCKTCRQWLGEFLISDKKSSSKTIRNK